MKRETARHREAFEVWWSSDRCSAAVQERFRVSERSVREWLAAFEWSKRADRRDVEAAQRADREAIRRRAKVLEDQRRCGELMRRRGTEYLVEHKIETAADAIRAIKEGVALERSAEQLPAFIYELLSMSEEELRAEHQRLTAQAGDNRHWEQTNGNCDLETLPAP